MEEFLSKNKRQLYGRLGSRKVREKTGLFLVEGYKSVSDLIRNGSGGFDIECIITTDTRRPEIVNLCEDIPDGQEMKGKHPTKIIVAQPKDIKEISTLVSPSDTIAVCRIPDRISEEEILSNPLPPDIYLMLDGIQDPGNLGTIIRTAHWFGVKHIFASYDTVDVYNPKCVQSSMGSLPSVSVDYVDLKRLAEANPDIPLVGLLLEGRDIFAESLPASAFVAMGNEGNGLSEKLRRSVSLPLTIPPYDRSDHSESLNVAVATAITIARFRH